MQNRDHYLSVNLEDYFQVAPLTGYVPRSYWERFSMRVERNTLDTLDLLDEYDSRATFFINGWIAERCPDLIAEVARRGHEIASKGFFHRPHSGMSIDQFKNDVLRARDAIEDAANRAVIGYRVAHGDLPVNNLNWFQVLGQSGVQFDSSVRPFGLDFRNRPDWRTTRKIAGDDWSLTEVPLSSQMICGIPVPLTGGNYLRQSPAALYDNRLQAFMRAGEMPWHLYFHVWEIDSDQPRVSAIPFRERIRQYRNLNTMRERIAHYLDQYKFKPIAEKLGLTEPDYNPAQQMAAAAEKPLILTNPITPAADAIPVSIAIPCYNEEASLPYLARTLAAFETRTPQYRFSYVFVDDGSQDETWSVLHTLFGDRDNCQLVRHPKNSGIAAATMTGIRAAQDDIVCSIDCDCSFDPHHLAKMIPLLTPDVDLVQASPYHPQGGVTNVPAWRLALSLNLSRIYRLLLNHAFHSYTACFRVYRKSAVQNLELDDHGFLGIAEIFIRLDQSGLKMVEFPAVLESRLLGASKMKTLSVIRSHVHMIVRLLTSRGSFNKGRMTVSTQGSERPVT